MDHPVFTQAEHVRHPDSPILPLLLARWSPRAMSGESLHDYELLPLFEAARWAPSSYNNQPWRFLYAKRETAHWPLFFEPLAPFNKLWVAHAAVLVALLSRNEFFHNNKPSRTHSFDTGAAWMSLALQGFSQGLVVHGMEGFDGSQLRTHLQIPENYTIEAMIAIGKPGDPANMPEEIRSKESPSQRRPVAETAFEGRFPDRP